jgi:hypothetical protein
MQVPNASLTPGVLQIDGGSGGAPPKEINPLELGQGPLSDGPNEGPPSSARSPCPDLWLHKVSPRRPSQEDRGLLSKPLEGHGAPGDQVALSQSPDALNHPTNGRSRPKRRGAPGLKVDNSQTSSPNPRSRYRPMQHGNREGVNTRTTWS